MCQPHYKRFMKYGNPLLGRAMKGEAQAFLLDAVDTCESETCIIWPYGKSSDGVGRLNWEGKAKNANRKALELYEKQDKDDKFYVCKNVVCENPACINPLHHEWRYCKK